MKNKQNCNLLTPNERRLVRINGEDIKEGLEYVHLYYIPNELADHLLHYVNKGITNSKIADTLRKFYSEIGCFPYVLTTQEKKLRFEELDDFWRNQLIAEYIEFHWQQIEPHLEINMELR